MRKLPQVSDIWMYAYTESDISHTAHYLFIERDINAIAKWHVICLEDGQITTCYCYGESQHGYGGWTYIC